MLNRVISIMSLSSFMVIVVACGASDFFEEEIPENDFYLVEELRESEVEAARLSLTPNQCSLAGKVINKGSGYRNVSVKWKGYRWDLQAQCLGRFDSNGSENRIKLRTRLKPGSKSIDFCVNEKIISWKYKAMPVQRLLRHPQKSRGHQCSWEGRKHVEGLNTSSKGVSSGKNQGAWCSWLAAEAAAKLSAASLSCILAIDEGFLNPLADALCALGTKGSQEAVNRLDKECKGRLTREKCQQKGLDYGWFPNREPQCQNLRKNCKTLGGKFYPKQQPQCQFRDPPAS